MVIPCFLHQEITLVIQHWLFSLTEFADFFLIQLRYCYVQAFSWTHLPHLSLPDFLRLKKSCAHIHVCTFPCPQNQSQYEPTFHTIQLTGLQLSTFWFFSAFREVKKEENSIGWKEGWDFGETLVKMTISWSTREVIIKCLCLPVDMCRYIVFTDVFMATHDLTHNADFHGYYPSILS